MRLRSGPHHRFMANGDSIVVATIVRSAGDHSDGGPREVLAQLNSRHRVAISLSPGKTMRRSVLASVSVRILREYTVRLVDRTSSLSIQWAAKSRGSSVCCSPSAFVWTTKVMTRGGHERGCC